MHCSPWERILTVCVAGELSHLAKPQHPFVRCSHALSFFCICINAQANTRLILSFDNLFDPPNSVARGIEECYYYEEPATFDNDAATPDTWRICCCGDFRVCEDQVLSSAPEVSFPLKLHLSIFIVSVSQQDTLSLTRLLCSEDRLPLPLYKPLRPPLLPLPPLPPLLPRPRRLQPLPQRLAAIRTRAAAMLAAVS